MKNKLTPQDIINQYVETGIISEKATLEGDYKTNNKQGKKLIKIFKELENDTELAISTLPMLLNHSNIVTRTDAAAHCLSLNICINEAVRCIEIIAKDEKDNIFGFNAGMTLKVWREQGYLKIYPTQEIKM